MDIIMKFVPERIKSLPTHMDFEGQRRAERTFQFILVLFAVVGFVWGYVCQQFSQTMYILGAGFILSCILTLPPWPIYRLKPLVWQKSLGSSQSDSLQPSPDKAKYKKKMK